MGKFLGLCFFVAGLAAIYVWGVRPLLRQGSSSQTTTPIVLSAQGSPTPVVLTADAQHAASAAESFFREWSGGQYAQMYAMLTMHARGRITRQAFIARYRAVMAEATVQHVTSEVLSV